jgi:hypothetical protein
MIAECTRHDIEALRTERGNRQDFVGEQVRLVIRGDYIRDHDSRIDSRGFAQARIGPLRVVDHRGEIRASLCPGSCGSSSTARM